MKKSGILNSEVASVVAGMGHMDWLSIENIKQELPDVEIEFMPHTDLKKNLAKTHAFIRTGEMTPYSNIILESGVTF